MRPRLIVPTCVLLLSACGSQSTVAPASRPTSADFAEADWHGKGFTVDFGFDSLPGGAMRRLRISSDGRCEGEYGALATKEMESGRRSGVLSPADRTAILVALRDARFDALERVPKEDVIDGEPVHLSVTVGERRLTIDRQMGELRAAGLEPLCRLLVSVLSHLPRE
jgi:hypothetical protein